MFSPRGNPSGMFSLAHFVLMGITYFIVIIALILLRKISYKKLDILTKIYTILILCLETIKIGYNHYYACFNLNSWFPLSYCALFIYAMILASFTKGKVKEMGKIFIACCFTAGFSFILLPTTSLTEVPYYHFLALYSFMYHGSMLFFGLLYIITGYVKIDFKKLIPYSIFVSIMCLIGTIIDIKYDVNLMFMMRLYSMPIELLNNLHIYLGYFHPIIITLIYIIGPFTLAYIISKIRNRKEIE